MKRFEVIFVFLFVAFICAEARFESFGRAEKPQLINSTCQTHLGKTGECKLFEDCTYAVNIDEDDVRTIPIMYNVRCGDIEGDKIVFCCPTIIGSSLRIGNEVGEKEPAKKVVEVTTSGTTRSKATRKPVESVIVGKECTTSNNEPGTCKLDSNCIETKNLNSNVKSQSSHENRCGFSGGSVVVCCPRPSVLACRRFGERPIFFVDRIMGGVNTTEHEFPHFVALGYGKENAATFDCGGALISRRHIVTAAHCVKVKTNLPFVARIGRQNINLKNEDYSDSDYKIADITIHPDYRGSKKYNDIALIRLETLVNLTNEIFPACLVQQNPVVNVPLIIAGFGQISEIDTTLRSDVLLKAEVEEIPLNECRHNYTEIYGDSRNIIGLREGITDQLLCAKNRKRHADTCKGDSGSGLYWEKNKTYYLVGVTSFGISCKTALPSFYSRVWSHLSWIESIAWPNL